MQYGSLTVSQMARVANVCAPGVNYRGSTKGDILRDFRAGARDPCFCKHDKEKFHRICSKAEAEIKKCRDAEWEALNRIIYEDSDE